jgi:type I restriction enzyme S subunit
MWTVRTLGEICDEIGGVIQTGPFGSQLHESDYVEDGVPVVMPKNILDGKIDTRDIAFISEEDVARLQRHKMSIGDIVYGRRGDIGRRGLIGVRENGWLCGTGCLRVSLGDRVIDPSYLYYFLGQPMVMGWIANQAVGATMPNLNTGILRSVTVRYPKLPIQRRIVSILSAYDVLIENNTRRIGVLKEMAKTIFRGANSDAWEFVRISDIYEELFDGPHATPKPSTAGPIYLGIKNVTERGELDLSDIRHIAEEDFPQWTRRVVPRPGDIVFTYEATLNRYGIINRDFRGCLGRRMALIRPDERRIDPYLFLHCLLSDQWRDEVRSKIISGATVDRIPLTTFPTFRLRVPGPEVRKRIGPAIRACEELAENCRRRNDVLRTTRDLLLPKLISGEVSVEAAAELVEQTA